MSFIASESDQNGVHDGASRNGAAHGRTSSNYYGSEARHREFHDATQAEVRRYDGKLARLREQAHELRLELVNRLGQFGFTYDPEAHVIVRYNAAGTLEAPPLPEAPTPPQPYSPPPRAARTPDPDPVWKEVLPWVAILPLGAFLGYSIGLMAGFDVARNLAFAVGSMVFGITILAMLKLSVGLIARETVRQARRTGSPAPIAMGLAAVVVLVGAEALLAAKAIEHYSLMTALRPEEALPFWACAVIALCFSTPVLAMSVVQGWSKGESYDFQIEGREREARRVHDETERARTDYERKREAHAQEVARLKAAAQRDFDEANQKFAENPHWHAALDLYGQVRVLAHEIAETERLKTNFKISRGYAEGKAVMGS